LQGVCDAPLASRAVIPARGITFAGVEGVGALVRRLEAILDAAKGAFQPRFPTPHGVSLAPLLLA
jgi:hypothetical protein